MSQTQSPPIIVFDVNETLLDIGNLEPLFERLFGHHEVMREWFAQLILYSQTLTLAGRYTPFGQLGVGTLEMVANYRSVPLTNKDVDELKWRMSTMPAHADVVPALQRLRDANMRLVTLTNSSHSSSPTPLARAGIDDFFEQHFSVEAVKKFKPAPETYRQVANSLGVATSDLCLVACHLWDTIGAQAAGCCGALVTRPHNAPLPAAEVPQPDMIAPDLSTLTDKIIAYYANSWC